MSGRGELGEDIRIGLLVLGWKPTGAVPVRGRPSTIFEHPDRGTRRLFLGSSGGLLVGRTVASAAPVHAGFRQHVLRRAEKALASVDLRQL